MSRRQNDPEGLRQALLDVAADSFQTLGYHGTSVHEIKRAAGVTGGALYHHYRTKKELGLAVVRERVAQAVTATWIVPVQAADNAAAGILSVLGDIIAAIEQRGRVRGCPVGNLALELSFTDAEFQAALRQIYDDWQAALAGALQRDGVADAGQLAGFVIAAYSGAILLAKAQQDAQPLRDCAGQLAAMLDAPTVAG